MHNKEQVLIAISRGVRLVECYHVYQTCIPNFQKQNNNITHLTLKYSHTHNVGVNGTGIGNSLPGFRSWLYYILFV